MKRLILFLACMCVLASGANTLKERREERRRMRALVSGEGTSTNSTQKRIAFARTAHKSKKKMAEEAALAKIRERYDAKVAEWKAQYGKDFQKPQTFEFWGFRFGAGFEDNFPGEKMIVKAQAQGLPIIDRMVKLKKPILSCDHADVGFTPCSVLLNNINFYFDTNGQTATNQTDELVVKIRDMIASQYSVEDVKTERRKDGRLEASLKKAEMSCSVFYYKPFVYVVIAHKPLSDVYDKERDFIGRIDGEVIKSEKKFEHPL